MKNLKKALYVFKSILKIVFNNLKDTSIFLKLDK